MRRLLSLAMLLVLLGVAVPAFADDTYVRGHTRKDGTYVQPHFRSAPDGNLNNWSTQGNVNPYTGKEGTRDPYVTNPGINTFGGHSWGSGSYGSGSNLLTPRRR